MTEPSATAPITPGATTIAPDPSQAVERYVPAAVGALPVLSDDEINRVYRQAQALAASRLYKDVQDAHQAFAKLLIGRTLGLNEAQSLTLYVVEGKIEAPYPMLAQFVRSRPGYDYRPAWIKAEGEGGDPAKGARVAVYCDEDSASDLREIVGAAVEFTVGGEMRGVSTWTVEDSARAGLTGKHGKYPRNMWLARCMANGCKWFVPEVLAGMPIYSEGEITRPADLGAGEGSGEGPEWTISIADAAKVLRVIRRAEALGHKGLADEDTARMVLKGASPERVAAWIAEATSQLDRLGQQVREREEAERVAATKPEGEPVDAIVVEPAVTEWTTEQAAAADAGTGPQRGDEHAADEPPIEVTATLLPPDPLEGAIAVDELGPMTADQLKAEIAEAAALMGAAQNEGEYEQAKARWARLKAIRDEGEQT